MKTAASGYPLYPLMAAPLMLFWRPHGLHRALAKHPNGGTWQEYQDRMRAEA